MPNSALIWSASTPSVAEIQILDPQADAFHQAQAGAGDQPGHQEMDANSVAPSSLG